MTTLGRIGGIILLIASIGVVIGILVGSYFTVRYFWNVFSIMDKEIVALVIATVITLITCVFIIVIGNRLVKKRELKQRYRVQKSAIYERLLDKWFDILRIPGRMQDKNIIKVMDDTSKSLILWCDSEVIKEYIEFKIAYLETGEDSNMFFYNFEKILFAIRKDLGLDNSRLQYGDLTRLILKDPEKVEKVLRNYSSDS